MIQIRAKIGNVSVLVNSDADGRDTIVAYSLIAQAADQCLRIYAELPADVEGETA